MNKLYIMVWVKDEENSNDEGKWFYFKEDFNEGQFDNEIGYADYGIQVENNIIVSDSFNSINTGKIFSETYDINL